MTAHEAFSALPSGRHGVDQRFRCPDLMGLLVLTRDIETEGFSFG
jgi:hypothetical protein